MSLPLPGAASLADGIITPAITVVSSIEGLRMINPDINVLYIVVIILTILFSIQQFGTDYIGKFFGPIMFCWFFTLGLLGALEIQDQVIVLKAFNPYYAINLLLNYPGASCCWELFF